MFAKLTQILRGGTEQAEEVFVLADKAAAETVRKVDAYVAPVRQTIFQRFPVFFALLVTTGVAAIILGIEQTILKYKFFEAHPEFILLIGVGILAFTGRLYKKLSD